jgi:uncharacterized protein YkwD
MGAPVFTGGLRCGTLGSGSRTGRGRCLNTRRSRPIPPSLLPFVLAAILGLGVPAVALARGAAPAAGSATPAERMALLVNQARTAQGLGPVAVSAELAAAAEAHARDVVAHG